MIYMMEVYALVIVPVFAVAGALLLTLAAFTKFQDYVRARRVMRQIVLEASGHVRKLRAA